MTAKKPRVDNRKPSRGDSALPWYRKGWQWLGDNGPAIQSVAIIGGAIWVLTLGYLRVQRLEEQVNGKGGVVETSNAVMAIDKRLISIEARLDLFDKYLLPQIFGSRAKAFLGTSDVEVFQVAHNEVTTDARFSTPYKVPLQGPPLQKQLLVTYTFEGIKDGVFIIRGQIEEEEGGKVVRTLYDRRIQGRLPTEIGKPDKYCFKFMNEGNKFETPPVCVEVVLLEQIGPDNLIFASALKPEETS